MPSTYISLYVHVIFSTKHRTPALGGELAGRTHQYLGGILRSLQVHPVRIGGVEDHVHLLFSMKSTHRIADIIREAKKASTAWLRNDMNKLNFEWQEGYAAFSEDLKQIQTLETYIVNQRDHHRTLSYLDELVALLHEAGVTYDLRYLD